MSLAAQKSLFLVLHAVVFRYGYQKVQGRKMQVTIVSAPQECVTIHGVVTELSPVKCRKKKNKKKKHFAGKFTDGKKAIWMVLFHLQLGSWLQESATSVELTDCQVKKGGFHKGLEIVAASRSKVVSLPRKFKLLYDLSRVDPNALTEVRIK